MNGKNSNLSLRAIFVGLVVATLLHSTANAATLIQHWDFNEGTGAVAGNSVGTFDGTIKNGAAWGTGTGDRASFLTFDGVNDVVSTAYMLPVQNSGTAYTWAVWVNGSTVATDASQRDAVIIGNRYGTGGNSSSIPGSTGSGSGAVQLAKFTVDGFEYRNTTDSNVAYTAFSINEWHHYAVVKSGTTLTVYLDGVATGPATTIAAYTTVAMPFSIGGDANSSLAIEHFAGSIDDVRIYSDALSASEIMALVVPEPSTSFLGALGVGFILIRRRR